MKTRKSSKDRQIELTDAALHLIAVEGIAALSTRKLAEKVNLSTGAIFRHFASLDALLEAVVARIETVLEATYPSPELPAAERLARFMEARNSVVNQQKNLPRLVLSEQFRLALPESGSKRLQACIDKTHVFLRGCLVEGQRDGVFRNDVDASTLALIVMGGFQALAFSEEVSATNKLRDGLLALLQNNQEKSP